MAQVKRVSAAEANAASEATGDAPKRRGRLHGAAVESLRQMIVCGRIQPGALLREKELCAELGISRTPLREAIRTLAREGLVKLSPNRSAVAAGVDLDETQSLYETIGHIEALGARLACERATDEDIKDLHVLHHKMLVFYYENDFPNYLALNRQIHRGIVIASRNVVLLEMWDILAPRVDRARSMTNLYPERWQAAMNEHESMIKSLSARDGEALARMMSEHYQNGLVVMRAASETGGMALPKSADD